MTMENKYAYELLDDEQKALYQEIYLGIAKGQRVVSCTQKCELAKVNKIIKYILLDYPELFWFEGKWGYRELEDGMQIGLAYTCPLENVSEYNKRLWMEIDSIMERVCGDDIQKARQIYDWMHENVSYGKSTSGQTAKDALVMHDAVCKGMSKAYQLLLAQAGIFSVLAEGSLDGKVKHVWNVVRLNEKYYHIDVALGYEEVWKRIGISEKEADFFGMSDDTVRKYCQVDTMEWMTFSCDEGLERGNI